jgi:hypothetical protein
MAQEFAHAIQIGMSSFSGSFQRTVGTIVVAEGLASRVTQRLFQTARKQTASNSRMVGCEWLAHGMSFSEIARIPEKGMPQRAAAEVDAILAASKR